MKLRNKIQVIGAFVLLQLLALNGVGQEELMDLLEEETSDTEYTMATFKACRIINGQSVETRSFGTLVFLIQHRFGTLNSGAYNYWGLDEANIRLGVEYGITDHLSVGIGRSSFHKVYDGYVKYKFLRQSKGKKNMPVSMAYFGSMAIQTERFADEEQDNLFSSRLYYVHQVLIARKFSPKFSMQLTPSLVHRNLVPTEQDNNDIIAIGVGGRFKISNRVSINGEWFPQVNNTNEFIYNAVALGIDLETGGHVFQLHFTNARSMIEKGFIADTYGNPFDGDIHFGFNISRDFQLASKK